MRDSIIIPKLIENENEKLRESLSEKEIKIVSYKDEIEHLNKCVSKLNRKLKEREENEVLFSSILNNYEAVFCNVIKDHEIIVEEKDAALRHLSSLEDAFKDLLDKYEKAKAVICGFQQNETILKEHAKFCEDQIDRLENRYVEFKEYATGKLRQANQVLCNNDKKHIAEMAKLKAKILQSQVKISDLEKRNSSSATSISNKSMFMPLQNNILLFKK